MERSNALVAKLENADFVDRLAEPLQAGVHRAVYTVPKLANALHGTWLGHPLHAALSDFPMGAWTSGVVLDGVELFGGTRKLRRGADAVHTIGLATSLAAALAGLADWSTTERRARRVGFVHGLLNVTIAGLFAASLVARKRGRRGLGIAASTTGFTLSLFSAWLGRELAYKLGVGVRPEQADVEPISEVRERSVEAPAPNV